MKALGREHMSLDQLEERHEGKGPMTNLIGQCRDRHVDAFALEARALPVERDVHAELVEEDGRQQLRADEAARRDMEWRRRLGDRLAIPARKFLPDRFDDLEAARDLLQRSGHVLTQLGQPRSAAAGAGSGRLDDDALALDILWPGFTHWPLAREGTHALGLRRRGDCGKLILARRRREVFQLQFQLLDKPCRALGALPVQFAFQPLDAQLEMRNQRLVVGQHGLRVGGFSLPVGSIGDSHIAFSLQCLTLGQQRHIGAGKIRGELNRLRSHMPIESHSIIFSTKKCYPTRAGRHVS